MNVLYEIFKVFESSKINYEQIEYYTYNNGYVRIIIFVLVNDKKVFDMEIGTSRQYQNIYYVSNMRNSLLERLKVRNKIKILCKLNKK